MMTPSTCTVRYIFLLAIVVFSFFRESPAQVSGMPSNRLRQITTHPEQDLAPRISPDGKWLAYASNRNGNYDIWLKNLETGQSRQLTEHQADDYYPVWEPRQRYLVFVSQRSDAKGDLFRLNLRSVLGELIAKGKPERLTFYLGFDAYPAISEYDEHIAWVSDRTGQPEIWLQTKRHQDVRQLTHGGATHPAWSPTQDYLAFTSFRETGNNGDIWLINLYAPRELFDVKTAVDSLERPMWPVTRGLAADGFPAWSPDSNSLLFLRSDIDTNNDGSLTPADKTELWSVEVSHVPKPQPDSLNPSLRIHQDLFDLRIATSARPVVPRTFDAKQPTYGADGGRYFVSSIKGNADIYSFESKHFFIPDTTTTAQTQFIERNFPLPQHLQSRNVFQLYTSFNRLSLTDVENQRLWNRILCFEELLNATPQSAEQAPAIYEVALAYYLLGVEEQAKHYLNAALSEYSDQGYITALATLLFNIIELNTGNHFSSAPLQQLQTEIARIQNEYADIPQFVAQTQIMQADIWRYLERDTPAQEIYSRIEEQFPQFPNLCAESQYKLGELAFDAGDHQQAFSVWLNVLQSYYEQEAWTFRARDAILRLLTADVSDDDQLLDRYQMIVRQFRNFDLFVLEPHYRIAELHAQRQNVDAAIQTYEYIIAEYSHLPEHIFRAFLEKSQVELKNGDLVQAVSTLQTAAERYEESLPDSAAVAQAEFLQLLVSSANELEAAQNYEFAATRYSRVLKHDPNHLKAHQGYITCLHRMGEIDQAIDEYTRHVDQHPNNNILLYALGLAYSYKGTQMSANELDPTAVDTDLLQRSNDYFRQALAIDYNLTEAYLSLSFNFEILENHMRWKRQQPKGFWTSTGETLAAPFVWLYRTVTFYSETRPPRYYESAIQELTRALALNDEQQQPRTEAMLALNLANNYYNLGEFGFKKAYDYYHESLKYDSTFFDHEQRVKILERMGHCALFVNDQDNGPQYLKQTIALYEQRNNEDRALLNIKRLALLYELGHNSEQAMAYYKIAADIENRRNYFDGLLRSYRSIAYHHFLMDQSDQAVFYANEALGLLESGKVARKKSNPVYMRLGVLGLYFPFPYDLRKFGAKSVIDLSTEEEEAFIYTILAQTFQENKMFKEAISFYEKKFQIYEQRYDYDAQAVFQNNMGYLYFISGDYDMAWKMFTNSYWMCRRTKYITGQLLNIENAARVVLTIAEEEDDEKRVHLVKYYNWITAKLAELLDLTREDAALYPAMRTHYHMLLSDLALVDLPLPSDTDLLNRSVTRLERIAKADSFLTIADSMATQYSLSPELCSIRKREGEILNVLNDKQTAFLKFKESRNLAIQNELLEVQWQIDNLLGEVLYDIQQSDPSKYPDQHPPQFYWREAISILESGIRQQPGLSASKLRAEHQRPYRYMIRYYLQNQQPNEAFVTAERMREYTFQMILGDDQLTLQNTQQQVLYERAQSLEQQIKELEFSLQNGGRSAAARQGSQRLQTVREQFDAALQDIRQHAPAIESLIKITPIRLERVQMQLPENQAILYHIALDTLSCFWIITDTSIFHVELPLRKRALQEQMAQLVAEPPTQTPEFLRTLKSELDAHGVTTLAIIPDYEFYHFPWASLSQHYSFPQVHSTSSSLTSYYYAVQPRASSDGKHVYVSDDSLARALFSQDYTVYLPTPQNTGNAITAQRPDMSQSNIIHIAATPQWSSTFPSYSRFAYDIKNSQPVSLAARQLYSLEPQASLVTLQVQNDTLTAFQSESIMAWERAITYSGIPSMLISLWPAQDSTLQFYREFYHHLKESTAAQAFHAAQTSLSNRDVPPQYWAGFQLYGFGGWNEEQRQQLLAGSVQAIMNRGERAFRQGNWQQAIELYRELLSPQQRVLNDSMRYEIEDSILRCAVNGELWNVAIDVQQQRIQRYGEQNQNRRVAEAYRYVAEYSREIGDTRSARNAEQRVQQLSRAFGFTLPAQHPYETMAQHLQAGGNYRRAIEMYRRAAQHYEQQGDQKKQLITMERAADIYVSDINDFVRAFEFYHQAYEQSPFDSIRVVLLNKLSENRLRLGVWSSAFSYNQQALVLVDSLKLDSLMPQCLLTRVKLLRAQGEPLNALAQVDSLLLTSPPTLQYLKALLIKSKIEFELDYHTSALERANQVLEQTTFVPDSELHQESRRTVGLFQWQLGNFAEALSQFEFLRSDSSDYAITPQNIRDNLNLAACLLDAGEIERAQQQAQITQTMSASLGDAYHRALSDLVLARTEADIDRSESLLHNATSLGNRFAFWDILVHGYSELARLYAAGNNQPASQRYTEQALYVISYASHIQPWDQRTQYMLRSPEAVLDTLIQERVQQNEAEEALELLEIRRTHTFATFMATLSKYDSPLESFTDYNRHVEALHLKRAERVSQRHELSRDSSQDTLAHAIIDSLDNLKNEMYSQNPQAGRLLFPFSDDSIRSFTSPSDSTTIAAFYYNENTLFLWTVTPDGIEGFTSPFDLAELQRHIRLLYQNLKTRADVTQQSRALYDILIQPWQAQFQRTPHLRIVPFHSLYYVPFALLKNENDVYLMDDFALSYTTGLRVETDRTAKNVDRSLISHTIAFTAPSFDNLNRELELSTNTAEYLRPLSTSSRVYSGERATEQRFKSVNFDTATVYAGTELVFDARSSLHSALLLTPTASDDGRFEFREMIHQRFSPNALVVSSAQQRQAYFANGSERFLFYTFFQRLGMQMACLPQWSSNNMASAALTKHFFLNVANGNSTPSALREAQRLIRQEVDAYEAAWAGFHMFVLPH